MDMSDTEYVLEEVELDKSRMNKQTAGVRTDGARTNGRAGRAEATANGFKLNEHEFRSRNYFAILSE